MTHDDLSAIAREFGVNSDALGRAMEWILARLKRDGVREITVPLLTHYMEDYNKSLRAFHDKVLHDSEFRNLLSDYVWKSCQESFLS